MKLSKKQLNLIDTFLNITIILLTVLAIITFIISFKNKSNNLNNLNISNTNINNTSTISLTNTNVKNINNTITNSNNADDNVSNTNNSNDTRSNSPSNIPYNSIGSKGNQVENFLAYVNEQKFCPNLYNSASSFWCRFPEKIGNGLLGKFCCTSCYYFTCEEIYCGNNNDGAYKLCKLSQNDIKNLRNYYDSHELDFEYPEHLLLEHIGDNVLKMKFDNIMYPIQIIKSKEELSKHEKEPTIANSLYKDTYKCNKNN